jgi:hypothetical protein
MLSLIGGGTVLAAGAASGTFLATRTPTSALAPWSAAGDYPDLPRRALSYALLAPNPHNRQPWVADIAGTGEVTIYRDQDRNLPNTDPFDRQLTIGMGCFLELLVQAAANEGVGTALTLFPEGDLPNKPVALARFGGSADPDPLFTQVMHRHTNRNPYDMSRPVGADQLKAIAGVATGEVRAAGTVDTEEVQSLRDFALEAMILETQTPHTHHETVRLLRLGKREIEANPDGISLGGPLMDSLALVGLLSRESAADPNSTAFASTLDIFRKSFAGTPAMFWLATPGNSREQQIDAGRSWVRAHLAATALGLSMQPVSQSLQEYPEMAEHYAEIHNRLAKPGEVLQMFGRLGYGPEQPPAPRWPLETRLKNG